MLHLFSGAEGTLQDRSGIQFGLWAVCLSKGRQSRNHAQGLERELVRENMSGMRRQADMISKDANSKAAQTQG